MEQVLDWKDQRELVVYDEMATAFENNLFCPECKDKIRIINRTCASCKNEFNFSDKDSPEGVVVKRHKQKSVTDGIDKLIEQRAREIIGKELMNK